jgi:hypothetical protein
MKCMHHFITYDPSFPYGCRAMNFKCRTLPNLEVRAASGMDCQMFRCRPASADFSDAADRQQKSR